MTQSLTRLPETAHIIIGERHIKIRNHKVESAEGLTGRIVSMMKNPHNNRETLYQFEKHGISFEMVIEYCANELEHDVDVFAWVIRHYKGALCNVDSPGGINWSKILNFSKSDTGTAIVGLLIDKIRNCNNWEELYDELHPESRFGRDVKNKIIGRMKQ